MRRLLLILMIALLPVRGWASAVISVASATQQLSVAVNATEIIATKATPALDRGIFYGYFDSRTSSSRPWACPIAEQAAEQAAAQAVYQATAQDGRTTTHVASSGWVKPFCHGCNSCQLCMALATGVSLPVVDFSAAAYPVPLQRTSGFSSATLPPGFKPPIA